MELKDKRSQLGIWAEVVLCSAMFFFLMGSIWIRQKYGVLLLATANKEFMNFLENKRSLFLVQVCIPATVFLILIVSIGIVVKRKTVARRYLHIILIAAAMIFAVVGWKKLELTSFIKYQAHRMEKHWYDENKVVIHALGAIEGKAYTNSKEALENSFSEGNRVFECDMILTADQRLVACHDWGLNMQEGISEDNIPTKEVFMNTKIYGKYTPLSIDEIVLFMKENKDVYIVTDTKAAEGDYYSIEFQEVVNAARAYECEEVLDRFIIQIYHAYMYGDIQKIYPFKNVIYTLYEEGYKGDPKEMEDYAQFCRLNQIDVITMREDYYTDELNSICQDYSVQLFVHTVNDVNRKEYFSERGVGVYTD